jgi:hypothetical protein
MYLAVIEPNNYLDFGDPVQFRTEATIVEHGLLNDEGKISGRAQAGVRPLSAVDFSRIIELGLGQEPKMLPRVCDHVDGGAPENGLPHKTSSLSYTQNGSTDDPSKLHGLSLIHRVSDTPLFFRNSAKPLGST